MLQIIMEQKQKQGQRETKGIEQLEKKHKQQMRIKKIYFYEHGL